ncbi:cytochrome c oxidase assembly protein [Georgenia halophila]|uniref:Cytochrome c oxidase assembly protein n=1 Tax=Georgenia halophila TaxID=620889 RepID=A0ABP8LMR2_9MICO
MTTAPVWASVVAAGLAGGYLVLLRRRPTALRTWPTWRTGAWLTGTAVIAVGLVLAGSGAGDHRVHMAAHLALGMYAPLALVLGAPVRLLLGSLGHASRLRVTALLASGVVRALSHPVMAAVLNVGGMFVLYLSPLYAASAEHAGLHLLVIGHFILAGYLYTWAIAGPDPAPHRPSLVVRAAVLVAAAGAHAFLAKLLYARAGELAGAHPGHGTAAGADVVGLEAAARLMYYGGDVAEILLALLLFGVWYRRRAGRHQGRAPSRSR